MSDTPHIRVGVVRSSRRIMGHRGNPGTTLCGAPLTAYDITAGEARRLSPADIARGRICEACVAKRPTYGRPVQ